MSPLRNFPLLFVVFILSVVTLAQADTKSLVNSPPPTKDPKCLLPKETGPCRMSLTRFYYNAETNSCEEFTFGGCKGNDNSFGFKETCEDACKTFALVKKQLNASTLKSLTYSAPVTQKAEVTTVTTPKPQVAVKH